MAMKLLIAMTSDIGWHGCMSNREGAERNSRNIDQVPSLVAAEKVLGRSYYFFFDSDISC